MKSKVFPFFKKKSKIVVDHEDFLTEKICQVERVTQTSLFSERSEIEGFIARHAESKEERVVQHFGNKLIRRVIKTTASAEVYQRTIKTYVSGNKALEAFHAEKRQAKKKRFEILAFDSTVSKPVQKRRLKEVQRFSRKVEVLGRRIPLEDGD